MVSDNRFFDYLIRNHRFRVYFDLTWPKGINKMNALEMTKKFEKKFPRKTYNKHD